MSPNKFLKNISKRADVTDNCARGMKFGSCSGRGDGEYMVFSFWRYLTILFGMISFDRVEQSIGHILYLVLQCHCDLFLILLALAVEQVT